MNRLIKQAFTLIELLVVIAIIGILSGLIVVSMGGVTNKATIAKAQVFSNSLRNSLMLNLVTEYKFDNAVTDSWGDNDGTWSGPTGTNTSANYLSDSECVSGQCLNFDGTDDFVNIPNNDILNLGDGDKGSVEIWVKVSTWPSSGYPSFIKKGTGGGWSAGSYHISFWGNYIRYVIYSSTTANNNVAVSAPSVNTWHHYVLTWSGVGGLVKGYLDGIAVNTGTSQTIKADFGITFPVRIGVGTDYFSGTIDGVRIYNTAIPTSQIQEQYYAGLNKLLTTGQITQKDYIDRISGLAINSLD
jgi:prepilin-type N-terminal cleavage/methylation domain-containing protein